MNKKTGITLGAFALLVVVAGVAWAMLRPDPRVEEIKALQQEMFANRESMDDDQRQQVREQMEQAREGLSEGQRQELRQQMRQTGMAMMEQRMDDFFALSEQDRIARLDEDIERMESMRQQFEQRRREREANGEAPRGEGRRGEGRGRGPGGGDGEERFKRILDHTTPEMRAKFTAYMQALNERREEMGLDPLRRPPFRGGFGHRPRDDGRDRG